MAGVVLCFRDYNTLEGYASIGLKDLYRQCYLSVGIVFVVLLGTTHRINFELDYNAYDFMKF